MVIDNIETVIEYVESKSEKLKILVTSFNAQLTKSFEYLNTADLFD